MNELQQFEVDVFYESRLSSRQPFRGVGSNWLFIIPLFDLVPGLSLPGLSVDMWLGLSYV